MFKQDQIKKEAMRILVAAKMCTTHKDETHTIPVYGDDSNTLDSSRRWIYEQQLKIHGKNKAEDFAKKTVLWVSSKELEEKIKELQKAA